MVTHVGGSRRRSVGGEADEPKLGANRSSSTSAEAAARAVTGYAKETSADGLVGIKRSRYP